ncbi:MULTISPECIES: hypothetical protein [unclassified Streptomyces]|uniref:hypothetical protein n=1 Tax=unclassified Streptomyces TaxID=2593676 RepID=UPI0022599A00|nr:MULTISPECIES: hypothetical protein [unclassified Streptomyces]MCX5140399.1 hypothetical protein [Streptomyces sp. NBC_00338]WRZ64952.1 hypothetical protein OG408_14140 [Streptomyces sp. NBC_01257]WSU58951.1 hypothetical protein OG450_14280 [Streptomyces sp. NBC_01104]
MTLLVHTFIRGRSGKRHFLDDPEYGHTLAGFEKSRTKLWGSRPARDLGARFLPQLATSDLYVEPEDVLAFLAECELLGDHIEALAAHSGYADDYVAERLANITAAAERALDVDGGVIVW